MRWSRTLGLPDFSLRKSRNLARQLMIGLLNSALFVNKVNLCPKPQGHWQQYDNCQKAANKSGTRAAFKKIYAGACDAAKDNGWLDNLFSNHPSQGLKKKPDSYWTIEKCMERAEICGYRKYFRNRFPSAYSTAHRNGWIDHIFAKHSNNGYSGIPPHNFRWAKEACKKTFDECAT